MTNFKNLSKACLLVAPLSLFAACVSTSAKVVTVSDDGKSMQIQLSTSDKSLLSHRPSDEAKDALGALSSRETLSLQLMATQAELTVLTGDLDGAEKQARIVLKRDIKNVDAAKTLIQVAILKGRYDEGKLMAQNALQNDPRNTDVLSLKGLCHYAVGEQLEAREAWKKALSIDASHISSQLNLGMLYYQNRNMNLADGMFERVLKLQPKNGDAAVGHAIVLSAQGHADESKRILEALLKNNSESPLILYNLAVIEKERLQDLDAAMDYLTKYLNAPKSERAIVERALALKEDLKGKIAERDRGKLSDEELRTLADKSSQAVQTHDDSETKAKPAMAKNDAAGAKTQKPESKKTNAGSPDILKDDVRSLEEDLK